MTEPRLPRHDGQSRKKRLQSAREVALEALCRVERDKAYANLILGHLLDENRLEPRDRALATELTYGTLRRRSYLDWLLGKFVRRPLAGQHPVLRNLLRLAAYQLIDLGIPAHAVCAESVRIARGHPAVRHAAGFVNAVCRSLAREGHAVAPPRREEGLIPYLAVTTSHPEWLLQRWVDQYGEETAERYAQANQQPAPTVLRVNRRRTTPADLQIDLEEEGVTVSPSPILPGALRIEGSRGIENLRAFRSGLCTAQDEGSQLVTWVLDPQPGAVVADVCSAPGSKTTHIAEWMDDTGTIWAFDLHPHRLALVEEACRRLGLSSVRTRVGDARRLGEELEACDAILVDAPCTGTGVLRRRPDLRWTRSPQELPELIRLQREILAGVAEHVRPGGILVYSTCSVDADENTGNMHWFLQHRGDYALEPFFDRLPPALVATLTPEQRETAQRGYLQLWPHLNQTDGFFIVRFRRKKGAIQEGVSASDM